MCPIQADVRDRITGLLKQKLHDQNDLMKFLGLLETAARKGSQLPSLRGAVVATTILDDCLDEVRSACEFPLPPMSCAQPHVESCFEREIQKLAESDVPPPKPVCVIMKYLRLDPDTVCIMKADNGYGVQLMILAHACPQPSIDLGAMIPWFR